MIGRVGDWTESQLIRFIQNMISERPTKSSPSFTADNLVAAQQLKCLDKVQFMQSQTTVGGAGGASALPATPSGYFRIYDKTGAVFVIPYYKSS